MKKSVHLLVTGMVQGVGFRYYVHHAARRHYLTGWVKNLDDGRVEALAEGDEEELRQFIKEIEKGSRFSTVQEVKVEWQAPGDRFRHFDIVT